MKKWMILLLTSASCLVGKEIHTDELKALIQSGKPLLILDARDKHDDGTRLPTAKSLPYTSTNEKILEVAPDKKAEIVIYCAGNKCPAGKFLADHLTEMGYENVWEYPEGIEGWIEAGEPIEHVKK